ncbi:hypothetical protein, partial [Enterobacter hormaechei]
TNGNLIKNKGVLTIKITKVIKSAMTRLNTHLNLLMTLIQLLSRLIKEPWFVPLLKIKVTNPQMLLSNCDITLEMSL